MSNQTDNDNDGDKAQGLLSGESRVEWVGKQALSREGADAYVWEGDKDVACIYADTDVEALRIAQQIAEEHNQHPHLLAHIAAQDKVIADLHADNMTLEYQAAEGDAHFDYFVRQAVAEAQQHPSPTQGGQGVEGEEV